jgi:hypothetical protein
MKQKRKKEIRISWWVEILGAHEVFDEFLFRVLNGVWQIISQAFLLFKIFFL